MKQLYVAAMTITMCGLANAATINVPGDYASIQEAIDASQDGDTVLIADGTYTESLDVYLSHSLHITSQNGPSTTVVRPTQSSNQYATAIDIQLLADGITVEVEGIQVAGHNGPGLYAYNPEWDSVLTIENCWFQKCAGFYLSDERYSIVRLENYSDGTTTLSNCRMEGNLYRALNLVGEGCTAVGCHVAGGFYWSYNSNTFSGGAVRLHAHSTMIGCVVRDNLTLVSGSPGQVLGTGVFTYGTSYLYGNIICGNRWSYSGAGSTNPGSQFYGGIIGSGNQISDDCDFNGPDNGACCLTTSCVETDLYGCIQAGGIFQGPLTTCDQVDCSNEGNLGACCVNGQCAPTNEYVCTTLGGEWAGEYTTCDDVTCTPPPAIAACCVSDNCLTTLESVCDLLGGIWQGDTSNCKSAACDSWVGACCVAGACTQISLEDCANLGGTYFGDLTACEDIECPGTCLGDLNGDGDVSVDDILILISGYGPCP